MKDQIGSYFYYPSFGFQKAAGGFGGIRIWSRPGIPVPFPPPAGDFTILAGDWFKRDQYVSISTWEYAGESDPPVSFHFLVSLIFSLWFYRYGDDSWTVVAISPSLMDFSSMVVGRMVTRLLLIKVSINVLLCVFLTAIAPSH